MRLYLDESVSVALATVLRQHGTDCLTAREAGHLGATDEFHLSFAALEGRVLFTHDTRDFLQLAIAWNTASQSDTRRNSVGTPSPSTGTDSPLPRLSVP